MNTPIKKILKIPQIHPKNEIQLYRDLSQMIGKEISDMGRPCYYPKLVKYYSDLKNDAGVNSIILKEFANEMKPYDKIAVINDESTKVLILCFLNFLRNKKENISKDFFRMLGIKFYSSAMHKHFTFCNPDAWVLALDGLSNKHLFKIKNGIGNTVFYLSDIVFDKYKTKLEKTVSLKDLITVIYELRHRISQSIRSFANLYYKIQEKGGAESARKDMEESANVTLIADKYSMIMCTYGQIDKEALKQSILKSGIRKDLSISTISALSNPEHKDALRFIIILIGRHGSLKDVCIDRRRTMLIRKINSNLKIGGKYLVKDEIKHLLYSLETGPSLRTIADAQVVMFFSHYITHFLKNRIC